MNRTPPVLRTGSAVFSALALLLVLTGCSPGEAGVPGLREQAGDAYVSGDSTVQVLPAAERGAPVEGVAGETLEGGTLDVTELRGGLVVLNVWGSWCGPCHGEAPDLVSAEARLTGPDGPGVEVQFVGLNIRDRSVEAAAGFEEEYGIGWPSLHDPDSSLLLRLEGEIPTNVVPATLVLDEQGRVAARLLSQVDEATLVGVVEDVVTGGGQA